MNIKIGKLRRKNNEWLDIMFYIPALQGNTSPKILFWIPFLGGKLKLNNLI
jgi:hypothetical protein